MAFVVFVPGGGFAGAVLRVVGHAADEFCEGLGIRRLEVGYGYVYGGEEETGEKEV